MLILSSMGKVSSIVAAQKAYIDIICEELDYTPTAVARGAGVAPSTINRFINTPNPGHALSSVTMAKLESFSKIPFKDTPGQVPLLGSVGAGETVSPIDDLPLTDGLSEREMQEMNCEFVDAPPGGMYRDLVALRVNGESMEPNFWDGDIVYYNQVIRSNFSDYLGKRVVVMLKDDRAFLKVLRKGTQYGKYRLESFNGKDIEDVELAWAAKVIFIKPA